MSAFLSILKKGVTVITNFLYLLASFLRIPTGVKLFVLVDDLLLFEIGWPPYHHPTLDPIQVRTLARPLQKGNVTSSQGKNGGKIKSFCCI